MIRSVKTAFARRTPPMIEDAFGVVALFVLLFIGLHLPAFT